ncbi:MAG: hypothetical protein EZS28_021930, partial [Streblomastix strix]
MYLFASITNATVKSPCLSKQKAHLELSQKYFVLFLHIYEASQILVLQPISTIYCFWIKTEHHFNRKQIKFSILLTNLGWIISYKKCHLTPQHQFSFLGWNFDAQLMTVQSTKVRKVELLKILQTQKEAIIQTRLMRIRGSCWPYRQAQLYQNIVQASITPPTHYKQSQISSIATTGMGIESNLQQRSSERAKLVDNIADIEQTNIINNQASRLPPYNRCIEMDVWRCAQNQKSGRNICIRQMVQRLEADLIKLKKTCCDPMQFEQARSRYGRTTNQSNKNIDRQHDNGLQSKSLSSSRSTCSNDKPNPELGRISRYPVAASLYTWDDAYYSRRSIQAGQVWRLLDFPSQSSTNNEQIRNLSADRCILNQKEQSPQIILLTSERQQSFIKGWSSNKLEQSVDLGSSTDTTDCKMSLKDTTRESRPNYINYIKLESPILATDIGQIDFAKNQFRSFRQNSESESIYEMQKLDNSSWKHDSFTDFIEQGENQIGEKFFRNCLKFKGATDQLITDVIKSWRTQWCRHAHGLTRFAKYLEEQQMKIPQLFCIDQSQFFVSNCLSLIRQSETHSAVMEARTAIKMLFDIVGQPLQQRLIQQMMKIHIRETSKIKGEEEIWHQDTLLNHIRLLAKDNKCSSTQTLAACMSSLIAFTNLRLSELFEAVLLKVSVAEIKQETMIWKGQQGRVQLSIRSLQNNLACQVFWILKWR